MLEPTAKVITLDIGTLIDFTGTKLNICVHKEENLASKSLDQIEKDEGPERS